MGKVRLLDHVVGKSYDTFLASSLTGGIRVGLRQMGVPLMWAAGFDGSGMVAGVLDTGIDGSHPDLVGQVISRRDYVNDGLPPNQWHYHGTHIAGIIAANGALKGVAPGAKLRDYRVLDRNGAGTWEAVTQAVKDALADGCDLINLSLGGPDDVPALHAAIQAFVAMAPAVVAVGNEGPGQASYPGYYHESIGVGAGDSSLGVAYFSNTNNEVDVFAPGVDILSCAPGGGYMILSGTSMAAPHAAGFMALLLQRAKARLGAPMTEPAAYAALKTSTVDVDALGIDARTGAGFVTIYPSLPVMRTVQVTDGSDIMLVDGQPVTLDVPARIENGRFLVPLRAPFEAARASVNWNETDQRATVEFLHVPGTEV